MSFPRAALALALLAGCTEEVDEALPPSIVSWEITPNTGSVGTEVVSTFTFENFALTDEEGDHHHDEDEDAVDDVGTDDNEHDDDDDGAEVLEGHVHIYFDDLQTNPLLMQTTNTATFMIPTSATAGLHTLIARLQHEDHTIIEPQVIEELEFEVVLP